MKKTAKKILATGLWMPSFIKPLIRLAYKCGIGLYEGMIFLRKLVFVEPVLRSIAEVGKGLRIERLPYIRGKGRLIIGDNVYISGQLVVTFMSTKGELPVVEIGDNTFVGHGSAISAARRVSIGNNVLIAAGSKIFDNDGHPIDAESRMAGGKISDREIDEVVIDDGVWIGLDSIILKGVRVAKNQIVGAGSILRRKSTQ